MIKLSKIDETVTCKPQTPYQKSKFESELTEKLNSKLSLIYEDINRSFIPFYEYTETEKNRLMPLVENLEIVKEKFMKLKHEIDTTF
jgi:hypothetical protein